jgi:CDP-4-dehydro-6-deoxyglucose reductase, E1
VTWPTTFWPVFLLGLRPVVVDCNLESLCLDESEPLPTDAVFNVHLLGRPSDVRSGVMVEDACEALGARYPDGSYCGTRGLMGTFSFYCSHHITTIEGGMVVSNDVSVYEELVMQRAHGWIRDLPEDRQQAWIERNKGLNRLFLFPTIGYNVRPTEIQAELGRPQLGMLDSWIERRTEIAHLYASARTDRFLPYTELGRHSWFAFPLVLGTGGTEAREQLERHFLEQRIPVRPIAAGNLMAQPFAERFLSCRPTLPNAQLVQQQGLFLSLSTFLSEESCQRTADAINQWK